jgi:hypothetical protein
LESQPICISGKQELPRIMEFSLFISKKSPEIPEKINLFMKFSVIKECNLKTYGNNENQFKMFISIIMNHSDPGQV